MLFIVGAIGFGIAGFALLFHQSWWSTIAAASAILSLLLLVNFWRNSLFIGPALDVAVLFSVLWLHWPPQIFSGR